MPAFFARCALRSLAGLMRAFGVFLARRTHEAVSRIGRTPLPFRFLTKLSRWRFGRPPPWAGPWKPPKAVTPSLRPRAIAMPGVAGRRREKGCAAAQAPQNWRRGGATRVDTQIGERLAEALREDPISGWQELSVRLSSSIRLSST